jgi:type II pantothenate kinase
LPWVGIDIGGTLSKVAYFEYYENGENIKYLGNNHTAVQDFIKSTHQYGSDGERDARLELKDVQLGSRKGNLHFIRFPTSRMDAFFELAEEMRAKELLQKKVYATGGGAYKFDNNFKEVMLSLCLDPTPHHML